MNLRFKYKSMLASLILIILVSTCSKKTGIHPDPDHLPKENEITNRIDFSDSYSEPFPDIPAIKDMRLVSAISDSSYRDNYDGKLIYHEKIAIDPSGNIYIPHIKSAINVYDSLGKYSYSIGRGGRGPGEFHRLYSFDFSEDYNKLYALDAFEVEIYHLKNGKFEYEKTLTHNLVVLNSICVLGDYFYISGFSPSPPGFKNKSPEDRIASYPINKFRIDNLELVKSFGFEYQAYNDLPQFNRFMSEMMLTCNGTSNTIVGQLKDFPYMFGYSPDGKVKWISKFNNYAGTQFIEELTPSLSLLPSNEEVYSKFYLFKDINDSKFELLQAGYEYPYSYLLARSRGENPVPLEIDGPKYRTILVDSETGKLQMSDAYGLIGAVRENQAILIEVLEEEQYVNQVSLYEY